VKHTMKSIAIAALVATGGCGGSGTDSGPLGDVQSLLVLERAARNDTGDIFQYTSYIPGARLLKLSPPTANGALTPICCDQDPLFANADIGGYDLDFDAQRVVFSARLSENQTYGLFMLTLADGKITQIVADPQRHFVAPIFLPGNKIMFTTNALDEAGAHQFKDEYERGESIQLGRVNTDGTGLELGARNLSHRTAPSLLSDGRVIFTQWDHLGDENSGHLMIVNQDMTELREGFGKENSAAWNSSLKAREISPGRLVVIATARNRTINAGALADVRLGKVENHDGVVSAPTLQSEANATFKDLTPDVPKDNGPSARSVGRYYDAFPLNAKDKLCVLGLGGEGVGEAAPLPAAGLPAQFGLYLYRSDTQQREPLLSAMNKWYVFARPLATRTAPPIVASAQDAKAGATTLFGGLNAYDSSLHTFKPGEIYGERFMEGFSGEEVTIPGQFGTPRFEGHANLGIAVVQPDGSFSARIPANIPIHIQAIDVFGMSLFTEPVWVSGRAGEGRVCGGCHEDRTRATVVTPGLLDTFARGATPMFATTPRAQRANAAPAAPTDIVGVPWDKLIQPILDAKCVSCHGDTNTAGIPGYTVTDPKTGQSASFTFNLSGGAVPAALAGATGGGFTKSYISMCGLDMEAVGRGMLMVTGNYKVYLKPEDAHGSIAIQMLNPTQLFPAPTATRAFPGTTPHMQGKGTDLTPTEFYALILAADNGCNFYARENAPRAN
jgi:hypothetical protein